MDVKVGEHLYTTDFFQISAFNLTDQIISIYYHVHPISALILDVKEKPFDFAPHQIADPKGESEVFRWINWVDIHPDSMTLPIDRVVMELIRQREY